MTETWISRPVVRSSRLTLAGAIGPSREHSIDGSHAHDRLDERTLNRTVGATARDAAEQVRKVAIARRLAAAILPDNRTVAVPGEWQTRRWVGHA